MLASFDVSRLHLLLHLIFPAPLHLQLLPCLVFDMEAFVSKSPGLAVVRQVADDACIETSHLWWRNYCRVFLCIVVAFTTGELEPVVFLLAGCD